MSYGLKLIVDLLLVIAVIIPAAQYPFQSWLIESVVAPTPVSAIMHAGIVNAGGIILTRLNFSKSIVHLKGKAYVQRYILGSLKKHLYILSK